MKIQIRRLYKNSSISIINILGLAIGISASIVIFLICNFEFSYNTFPDSRKIYRLYSVNETGDQKLKSPGIPGILPRELKFKDSLSYQVASIWDQVEKTVTIFDDEQKKEFLHQKGIIFAEGDLFNVFGMEVLAGDRSDLLTRSNQIVLDEIRARLYFPQVDFKSIIGKTITHDTVTLQVSGIVKSLRTPSDLQFHEFVSYQTFFSLGLDSLTGWNQPTSINTYAQTFIKINSIHDKARVKSLLLQLSNEWLKRGAKITFDAQSIKDMHFDSELSVFDNRQVTRESLYSLILCGFFVLVLSCLNYVNLITAQTPQRAIEIGLKKTFGASKLALLWQLIKEAFLVTFISCIISFAFYPVFLGMFQNFIPPELNLDLFRHPDILVFVLVLILIITLFAGLYPAYIISKFNPQITLRMRNRMDSKGRPSVFRNFIFVFQFSIAQILVVGLLIVNSQMSYIRSKDLGFTSKGVLYFNVPRPITKNDNRKNVLRDKIERLAKVDDVSLAGEPPAVAKDATGTFKVRNGSDIKTISVETKRIDPGYFGVYKIKLILGRLPNNSDTLREYLVNESFVRNLGLEHINDIFTYTVDGKFPIPIVGVVSDFNSKSLYHPINPVLLSCRNPVNNTMHVSYNEDSDSQNLEFLVNQIKSEFGKIYPGETPDIAFFEQTLQSFYKSEISLAKLLSWGSALSIIISCLGLLGLIMFTVNEKIREITIRKVFGATKKQILILLFRKYLIFVVISSIISIPIAHFFGNKYLEYFSFRSNPGFGIFLASIILMSLVVFMTIFYHTLKLAGQSPAENLRVE